MIIVVFIVTGQQSLTLTKIYVKHVIAFTVVSYGNAVLFRITFTNR